MRIQSARNSLFFQYVYKCNKCNKEHKKHYRKIVVDIYLCNKCHNEEIDRWLCNNRDIRFIDYLIDKFK